MQLAVLHHNTHAERENAKTRNEDLRYHRKYRKASKQWDATPVMCKKQYSYISAMTDEIIEEHKASDGSVSYQTVATDHPLLIQSTIDHIPPSTTSHIVNNKRSRFK